MAEFTGQGWAMAIAGTRAAQFTEFGVGGEGDCAKSGSSSPGTDDCGGADNFGDAHSTSCSEEAAFEDDENGSPFSHANLDKLLGLNGLQGQFRVREIPCKGVAPVICLPVCTVPGQSTYVGGGLMCSTCATILGLSVSAGLMPDPGSIPKRICVDLLNLVMQKSSTIQQDWLRQVAKRGGDEMRQIAEVVALVVASDEQGSFARAGKQVECFGPLSHGGPCTVSYLSQCCTKSPLLTPWTPVSRP